MHLYNRFKRLISYLYFILIFTVLTFYTQSGFYDLAEAKAYIATVVAMVFALIAVVCGIFDFGRTCVRREFKQVISRLTVGDYLISSFIIICFLSCVMSEYGWDSVWGTYGFECGGFLLISLGIIALFISHNFEYHQNLWLLMILSVGVQFILGILNCFGVDPLNIHFDLGEQQYYGYVGTIGNINWYAGYISVLLSSIMFFFIYSGGRSRVLYGVLLGLGVVNAYLCKSDSVVIGLGLVAFVLIVYCLRDSESLYALAIEYVIFVIGSVFVAILRLPDPERKVVRDTDAMALFLKPISLGVLIVVAIIIWLFIIRRKLVIKNTRLVQRIVICIFLLGLGAYGAFIGIHFSDTWGNSRGFIWKYAFRLYESYSIKNKLIGCGPECFGLELYTRFYDEIVVFWGTETFIANTHNEFIQYLVTIGILGLISYLGIFIRNIILFFSCDDENVLHRALAIGIIGYLGQALVNNPQALNVSILFLYIGIAEACLAKGDLRR